MGGKTKILIYFPIWKRPEITELCFLGIERLKKHPDFEIKAFAVISELEMVPLCLKYDCHWTFHANEPLGSKLNWGLSKAKFLDFDYLMNIGSDDLILSELLDTYKDVNHEFFGIRDIAFLNSETGECRRKTGKTTYGAGRMISRKVLEKVNFKLWNDKLNRGLDNDSIITVMGKKIGYKQVIQGEFPMVIDVKSDQNIWKFDYSLGIEYDKEVLFEKLSREEVELIKSMYARQQN